MNKYNLSKRQAVNELSTFYSFLAGFLIALVIGSIILLIQDKNPIDTFSLMFKLSVGSVNSLSSSLNKATPLILAGLGIAIINTVKLWNIGAEGQIFMGAIAVNLFYINLNLSNPTIFILFGLIFIRIINIVSKLVRPGLVIIFSDNALSMFLIGKLKTFGRKIGIVPLKIPIKLNFFNTTDDFG